MREKIVICMAMKNAERTLRSSIASVKNQKGVKREIILLIGNDASNDSSCSIITEFVPNLNIILLDLSFENAAKTRNFLNNYARNYIQGVALIGRLDADDALYDAFTISRIETLYEKYGFDIYMGGNMQIKNGEILEWVNRPSKRLLEGAFLLGQLEGMAKGNPQAELPSCNTFIKPNVEMDYPEKLSAEDHWFTVLLLLSKSRYNIYFDEVNIYCHYSLDGVTSSSNKRNASYIAERNALYDYARNNLRNGTLSSTKDHWTKFIHHEGVLFHSKNAHDNKDRLSAYWNKNCDIHRNLESLILKLGTRHLKLLDAGCGPFPKSGIRLPGYSIERTLIDVLADQYHQMLRELEIDTHEQMIISCELENTAKYFSGSFFDIVFAKNCIDHTYDPFDAIKNLVSITRKGGFVYLEHYKNEGEYTGYTGLHQWNIDLEGSDLVISDKHGLCRKNINEMIAPNAIQAYEIDNRIYAVIRKSE